jgi:glycosyltransferase involved in cell wall biosynthesis
MLGMDSIRTNKADTNGNQMNVLVVTSLFYPEIAANAKRMTHLAEGLREKGHKVSVITAFPYYSTSRNVGTYKGKWIAEDQYQGVPVIRTYAYSCKDYGNFLKRLWCFISFMLSSIFGAFKIKGKVDVVVTISPPFFSLFSGYIISRMKRACWVLDIQDIYPETLTALGFVKNRIAIKLLQWLEKFFYRKADGMAAISDGFKQDFIDKGAKPGGIEIVPNWADADLFRPRDGKDLRQKYGMDGKFVVTFMGNIGLAQALENLVEAATLLRDYEDAIEFVLLGEGVEKQRIKDMVAKHGLSNFIFIPSKPNSDVPDFLSLANACLVYLRKNDLYEITVPCKTYEYMAMAKPVIMGVKGEALRLIEAGKCGIGVEPESPQDLAKAILELNRDRNLAMEMGARGRRYLLANFKKETIVSRYIDLLRRCGTRSPRSTRSAAVNGQVRCFRPDSSRKEQPR